jgi:outer membrane protein
MFLLLALLPAASSWAQSGAKLGYVDWTRLVESAPQIALARDKLDAEFRPRNELIEASEAELRQLEEQFQRDNAIMGAGEVRSLEQRIRTLRRDVQRNREDLADELDFRINEERQRVEDEIYEIVRTFAVSNEYDLILAGRALFVSDAIDLTDELLGQLRSTPDPEVEAN